MKYKLYIIDNGQWIVQSDRLVNVLQVYYDIIKFHHDSVFWKKLGIRSIESKLSILYGALLKDVLDLYLKALEVKHEG